MRYSPVYTDIHLYRYTCHPDSRLHKYGRILYTYGTWQRALYIYMQRVAAQAMVSKFKQQRGPQRGVAPRSPSVCVCRLPWTSHVPVADGSRRRCLCRFG